MNLNWDLMSLFQAWSGLCRALKNGAASMLVRVCGTFAGLLRLVGLVTMLFT